MMSLRPGAVNFGEKWSGLRETIQAVVQLQTVRMATWNDHYSDIYALCEAFPHSYAEQLYQETKTLLEGFVRGVCKLLLPLDPQSLLAGYQHHWLNYQQGAKYLDNLFSYFNRVSLRKYQPSESIDYALPGIFTPQPTPLPQNTPVEIRNVPGQLSIVWSPTGQRAGNCLASQTRPTKAQMVFSITHMKKNTVDREILTMVLRVWRYEMIEKVRDTLLKALLEEIRRDRAGQSANLGMVRDVIFSLIEVEEFNKDSALKLYQEAFESPFLQDAGEYYRQEASKLVAELSCSEYMAQVVSQLKAARRSGQKFLHQTSITKFVRECEARLVGDYRVDYLYSHTKVMVQEERRRDLSNLFVLLSGIPHALEPVILEFEDHVKCQGLTAFDKLQLDKSPNVSEFMNAVLSVHGKFLGMVREVFGGHQRFHSALDQACRVFVNIPEKPKQQPKAPLLLARYCDQLLRKSSKGIGEQEVEDRLEEAITVFRYIDDKDLFQRFYSRMLSRRLVQNLSLSMEAEESMIQKLKHACGYEYTARLQRMVVDMKLSTDCMSEFQEHLQTVGMSLPISFSTLVLQSAAWPFHCLSSTFAVPNELVSSIRRFEMYYVQKHSGRKLTWLHHMSLGEVKMHHQRRPYTICVTTFQMATLLAFNQSDMHTYSSLLQCTQLRDPDLLVTLQSLVDCKLLLLEEGQALGHSSVVKLNKSYTNKRTKFKVTAAFQKDSQQEIEQTQFSVQEDRKLHTQAAIVRVMKARKSLKHNQLIEETITQLKSRFTPNVQTIKKCIETLIDKQYLERNTHSRDTYNYMA